MDVFELHQHVIDDYAAYTKSFIQISDTRIAEAVRREISEGLLWPQPLLQLNPSFARGKKIDELIGEGILHEDCGRIFRIKKHDNDFGRDLRLHLHQEQAIRLGASEPVVRLDNRNRVRQEPVVHRSCGRLCAPDG